jgi:hypothetical protein
MAVTVNVGFSRKVGEPNYGSRGASVQLEVELDQAAIEHGEQLQAEIEKMFQRARDAVERELQRKPSPSSEGEAVLEGGCDSIKSEHHTTRVPRLATPYQIRAIQTIAENRGIDLNGLLETDFGTKTAEELTIVAASRLIDRLKSFPIRRDPDSAEDR